MLPLVTVRPPAPVAVRLAKPVMAPDKVARAVPELIVPSKPPFKAPRVIAALVVLKVVAAASVKAPE